jgi:hypothetical protein
MVVRCNRNRNRTNLYKCCPQAQLTDIAAVHNTTQHFGTIVRACTNLYKCSGLPALLYVAAEAWALTQAQLTGIAAVHNAFLRRILGRHRRSPREG